MASELIAGGIPNLFNGVSEQTPAMRLPTQGESCDNFFPSLVEGLLKRPPVKFIANLPQKYANCRMHHIQRDADQEYILMLGDNVLGVTDMLGREQSVTFEDGTTSYLDTTNLGAYTVADYTFILNKDKTVLTGQEKTAARNKSILINVKQVSYQTDYTVKLYADGEAIAHVITSTPHNIGTEEKPPEPISTEKVAKKLAEWIRDVADGNVGRYAKVVHRGSTVYIYPLSPDIDLSCEVNDSRGNTHIVAISDVVSNFSDLPIIAPVGYTAKVVGDPSSADDYYVRFVAEDVAGGSGPASDYHRVGHIKIDTIAPNTKYTVKMERADGAQATANYTTPSSLSKEGAMRMTLSGITPAYNTQYRVVMFYDGNPYAEGTYSTPPPGLSGALKIALNLDALTVKRDYWLTLKYKTLSGERSIRVKAFNFLGPQSTSSGFVIGEGAIQLGWIMSDFEAQLPQDTSLSVDYLSRKIWVESPGGTVVFTGFTVEDNQTGTVYNNYWSTLRGTTGGTLPSASQIAADICAQLNASVPPGPTRDSMTIYNVGGTIYLDENIPSTRMVIGGNYSTGGVATPLSGDRRPLGGSATMTPADLARNVLDALIAAVEITPKLKSTYNIYISTSTSANTVSVYARDGHESLRFKLSAHDNAGYNFPITYDDKQDIEGVGDQMLRSGVWYESVRPNITKGLDNSTMPHALVLTKGKFTFKRLPWGERTVGDEESAPDPSFVERKIKNMFLNRNRLGFLSADTVSMSAAGDFFRFFPETVMTHVSSDPIFLASGHAEVTELLYAKPLQESLIVFAERAQFQLTSGDILSPETAEMPVATTFEMMPNVEPVSNGRTLFYCVGTHNTTGVREYYVENELGTKNAANITSHVPQYITGARRLECSTQEDILVVQPSLGTPRDLYVYKYYWSGSEKLQAAWVRFTFEYNVRDILFAGSKLYMIVAHGENTMLVSMDFSEKTYVPAPGSAAVAYLDYQVELVNGTYHAAANETVWSVPYKIDRASAKRARVVNKTTFQEAPIKEVSDYTVRVEGDCTTGSYVFGFGYDASYVFSEQFLRQEDGNGRISTHQGRLQFRRWSLIYGPSSYFKITVDHKGGHRYEYPFTGLVLAEPESKLGKLMIRNGTFYFPVKGASDSVTVTLTNDSYMPCSILSAEWEALYTTRNRRI